jgi:Phospholipase_D-nuclease N-terminal
MGRLLVLFAIVDLAILMTALIDCLSVPAEGIRALPRAVWALIIIFFSPFGGIAWYFLGRPVAVPAEATTAHPAGTGRASTGAGIARPDAAARAPDDDQDFLRSLGGTSPSVTREDYELLRMWEADLRRREEQLRRERGGDQPEPPGGQGGDQPAPPSQRSGDRTEPPGDTAHPSGD